MNPCTHASLRPARCWMRHPISSKCVMARCAPGWTCSGRSRRSRCMPSSLPSSLPLTHTHTHTHTHCKHTRAHMHTLHAHTAHAHTQKCPKYHYCYYHSCRSIFALIYPPTNASACPQGGICSVREPRNRCTQGVNAAGTATGPYVANAVGGERLQGRGLHQVQPCGHRGTTAENPADHPRGL